MHVYQASSTSVAATASSVSGALTFPNGANGLHIANTSATLYVTVGWGSSAPTVTLGGSLTLPPMGQVEVDVNPQTAFVAAIGSAAGPTAVVFTPIRRETA